MKTILKTLSSLLFFAITATGIVKAQQPYNIYFGNIHSHTSYSDGTQDSLTSKIKTPAEAYAYAKKTQHLDFLGISEHNHSEAGMKSPKNYQKGLKQAKEASENGKFIALYGIEYGVISNGGHVLIYGFDKLIGWEAGNYDIFNSKYDYKALFKLISENKDAFATLAHPEATHFNDVKGQAYSLVADQAISGIAIATGQARSAVTNYSVKRPLRFYPYYTQMLSKGYIVGPTIDHDNHFTTFGRHTAARTAVLAKSLSKEDIVDAYRNNRFYATQDWNAMVDFTINAQPMGSYLKQQATLEIKATVTDKDAGDTVRSIELIYGDPTSGGTPPKKLASATTGSLTYQFNLDPGKASYFFLKITQADGDQIITSPIWAKN